MRAALYARFSTDGTRVHSNADQLKACRRLAEDLGATVAGEEQDDAISGSAMGNRPGFLQLMALAKAGAIDVVITEHTDRLSRGLADLPAIYLDLKAMGIGIHTVLQGRVSTVHVGISSTMSALMIEDIADKTRRGLKGVVERGRSAGGLTYGYQVKRAYDATGERLRGLLEVNETQAHVVRRVFRDYAAGASSRAIAAALNREGVPGPRGGAWNASTIHGNAQRGQGILHNELYRGVRVWGRRTFVKDRQSGKRRGIDGSGEIMREAAAELAIVDAALWTAVHERHAAIAAAMGPELRLAGARRPKLFLSGLIRCGLCGGAMVRAGRAGALRCASRIERGDSGCANTKAPAYGPLEARVLRSLQANLLHPDVLAEAVREFQRESALLARGEARQRGDVEKELAEIQRRMSRLIGQVEEGAPWTAVAGRHGELDARRVSLEQDLVSAGDAQVVQLHPSAAGVYRDLLAKLTEAVASPEARETTEARDALRRLVAEVRFTPRPEFGKYDLEVVGDLAPLLKLGATNRNGPLSGAVNLSEEYHPLGSVGAGNRTHHSSQATRLSWAA